MDTLCDATHFTPRFLYTTSTRTVLVLYSFEHYGDAQISFTVSITNCQIVKINLCLFFGNKLETGNSNLIYGEYKLVYEKMYKHMKPVFVVNATGHNCTVAQVFSKPEKFCTNRFWDLLGPDFSAHQHWFRIHMHVLLEDKVSQESGSVDSALLRATGVLISRSCILSSKHMSEEGKSLLLVNNSAIFDQRQSETYDSSITLRGDHWLDKESVSVVEFSEGKYKLLDVGTNNMQKRILGKSSSGNHSYQTVHLRPHKLTDWIFDFKSETNAPIHKDSLHFNIEMFGFKNWIDILVLPLKKPVTGKCSFPIKYQTKSILLRATEAVLVFSIQKEHLLKKLIKIKVSLATKVCSLCSLVFESYKINMS